MTRLSADEQAARDARMAAIRSCGGCDPSGWRLGPDGTPVDPAQRCDHGTPPALGIVRERDITEPIHEQPGRLEGRP